jgi:hypothetical protein
MASVCAMKGIGSTSSCARSKVKDSLIFCGIMTGRTVGLSVRLDLTTEFHIWAACA